VAGEGSVRQILTNNNSKSYKKIRLILIVYFCFMSYFTGKILIIIQIPALWNQIKRGENMKMSLFGFIIIVTMFVASCSSMKYETEGDILNENPDQPTMGTIEPGHE